MKMEKIRVLMKMEKTSKQFIIGNTRESTVDSIHYHWCTEVKPRHVLSRRGALHESDSALGLNYII